MTPDAQPWCHHCDRPLTERDTLRTPGERIGGNKVVELVCARCLHLPGDDGPQEPNGERNETTAPTN